VLLQGFGERQLQQCTAKWSCPLWPIAAGAGVDSGYQLRLEGVLPAGPQGRPEGDLMVQIEVGPSPVFRRENFDLYVDVSVDMVDACLGTSVE
jgi:DnaJ-class molecular chaperone